MDIRTNIKISLFESPNGEPIALLKGKTTRLSGFIVLPENLAVAPAAQIELGLVADETLGAVSVSVSTKVIDLSADLYSQSGSVPDAIQDLSAPVTPGALVKAIFTGGDLANAANGKALRVEIIRYGGVGRSDHEAGAQLIAAYLSVLVVDEDGIAAAAAAEAAAESYADGLLSVHVAAADPHTGYRLESADHSHQSTGLQAGQLDHGLALAGLGDDDHTQYHNDARALTWLGTRSIADLGTKTHALLGSLSADDHTQYLLAADATNRTVFATDWALLVGGGATTLHSHAGGGGMAIGGAVTSGTPGSILFVGAGSVLAQNNTGLFWDNADGFLGLGTTPSQQFEITGNFRLPPTTTDNLSGQIRSGGSRFISNAGNSNTFIGLNAGTIAISGISNVGLGTSALASITSGSENVALGAGVLAALTSGSDNLGIGFGTLATLTTGSDNVAIGKGALGSAAYNGSFNTALGSGAFKSLTTGSGVAIGNNALNAATTNDANVAVGNNTLLSLTTGAGNTGVGGGALQSSTTQDFNTGIGYQAGITNTTGTHNTLIGATANVASAALTQASAIGYGAVVADSNHMIFGTSAECVGIAGARRPSGTGGLIFSDGTALSSMASNTAGLYADDISGNVSMHAINENGDVIKLIKTNTYTQTYSTADRTLSAYTADPESSAYTGIDNTQAGTPYAQLADINALRVAYENLRAFTEDIAGMVNGVIDDLQTIGYFA